MSWEDSKTDMAHCAWCSWDLFKWRAIKGMHPECVPKAERRNQLRAALKPVLTDLGIERVDFNNLLTDICRRIEQELDSE